MLKTTKTLLIVFLVGQLAAPSFCQDNPTDLTACSRFIEDTLPLLMSLRLPETLFEVINSASAYITILGVEENKCVGLTKENVRDATDDLLGETDDCKDGFANFVFLGT